MDFFSGANNIIGIATILGTIAAWIALYPIVQPYLLKLTGKTIPVDEFETSYLISLEKDLETKNQNNRWSNKFYVNVDVELQERKKRYEIPPSFYVVKAINRHLKDQDFNNLSNVEKIDSSRGQTFRSLRAAANAGLILEKTSQVTIAHFTAEKFKEFQLLLPPLSLQEEFAGVVARVESLRGRMGESERQVEGLFESLLSQSFESKRRK